MGRQILQVSEFILAIVHISSKTGIRPGLHLMDRLGEESCVLNPGGVQTWEKQIRNKDVDLFI